MLIEAAHGDGTRDAIATLEVSVEARGLSGYVSLPDGFTVAEGETVEFDPTTDTTVEVGANVVVEGALRMRPQPGVTHTLRFVGVDETAYVGGGMQVLDSDVGLWITGDGQLDAAGQVKTPWLRLTQPLAQGATAVTLPTVPTGWRVGDELLIAPSEPVSVGYHHQHDEVRTIAAIDGATVTLAAPLAFPHPVFVRPDNGQPMGPEVGNLTRSVNIEGTPTGRAHVLRLHPHNGMADLSHVAFRHLGPQQDTGGTYLSGGVRHPIYDGVLGRYPLHIHHGGDGTRGTVHTGLVVRDSGNHAFVPHAAHGITLNGCIAHNVLESAFWWDGPPAGDDTSSVNDTLDAAFVDCWASRVAVSPGGKSTRLSSFALGRGDGLATAPRGTATGCVATGNQGTKDASGFAWPETAQSMWRFEDCVSHNNGAHGVFVWQNSDKPHLIERLVCYRNGRASEGDGIRHGAYRNAYRYLGCLSAGNAGWGFGKSAASSRAVTGETLHIDGWYDTLRLTRHNLPAGVEGLVTGHVGRLVVDESDPESKRDLVLFDQTGLTPADVQVLSIRPDTVLRFRDLDGSEWQVTG